MLRFRLFGIPFEVAPYFWIVSALLSGDAAHGPNAVLLVAVWVACVFVSIVVHEMGHALVARRYGAAPVVRMYALGGVTQPGRGFTRGQNLLVVIGGPAAGLGLYLVVRGVTQFLLASAPGARDFLLTGVPTELVDGYNALFLIRNYSSLPLLPQAAPAGIAAGSALSDLLFINWYWTMFNLLPILPLDGGLILRNVLGSERVVLARVIGAACAGGCAAWAFSVGQTYMALFLGLLAFQNFRGSLALPGSVGK